jgi:hypothetical protein
MAQRTRRESAIRFCQQVEDLHDDLGLIGFVPFAILVIGVLAFFRPSWLRWVNMAAFTAAGLILIGICFAAGEFDIGFVALLAWGVAVTVPLLMMLGKFR